MPLFMPQMLWICQLCCKKQEEPVKTHWSRAGFEPTTKPGHQFVLESSEFDIPGAALFARTPRAGIGNHCNKQEEPVKTDWSRAGFEPTTKPGHQFVLESSEFDIPGAALFARTPRAGIGNHCNKQEEPVKTLLVPGPGSNPRPPEHQSFITRRSNCSAKRSRPPCRICW
ncbi:hypothetical protein Bbelb_308980 [Branchiostoma belcheri]|nr:hypothetical protein Bbelb_308980 [Branchiostoma belcheri]